MASLTPSGPEGTQFPMDLPDIWLFGVPGLGLPQPAFSKHSRIVLFKKKKKHPSLL